MKAIEQYFPLVVFTMLYKVVLTFESMDEIHEILKCENTNKNYRAVFSCGIMLYKMVLTFESR